MKKSKYTIKILLTFDLNNPKNINGVTIKDIVECLEQYKDDEKYDEYKKDIEKILVNEKRLKSFYKSLEEYTININKQTNYKNKKSEKFVVDDEDTSLQWLDDLDLTEYEWEIIHILSILLREKVTVMCLPLVEKNLQQKQKEFTNNQLKLAILLKQMGKEEESETLLSMKSNFIHSFATYTKDWTEEYTSYLEEVFSFPKTKAKKVIKEIVKNVKKTYQNQEKSKMAMSKNARSNTEVMNNITKFDSLFILEVSKIAKKDLIQIEKIFKIYLKEHLENEMNETLVNTPLSKEQQAKLSKKILNSFYSIF